LKHEFIDQYAYLNSPVHRIDPRAKVLSAFTAIVIVVSENLDGGTGHFLWYLAVFFCVAFLSGLPIRFLLKRTMMVIPFIVMAAFFYPVAALLDGQTVALSLNDPEINTAMIIFSKSLIAVIILVLLTSTERFHRLLLALRKLKMPKLICSISALLYRYIFLLADEARRTTLARESRTPGKLAVSRITVYGNQAGVIFLRSWERSQTLYSSMLSRGFTGEFPDMHQLNLGKVDVISCSVFIFVLLIIRFWI